MQLFYAKKGGAPVAVKESEFIPKPWVVLSTRYDADYRVFRLRADRAVSPRTGEAHDFFVFESPDWVNVIPVTEKDEVVMIRQYRHGLREVTLEIPGGLVEAGDRPEDAARRELLEETGYRAGEWRSLGWIHPNPAIQNNRCFTFLARRASPADVQRLDDEEDIGVLRVPLSSIPSLIREGRITHSLIIAAFYRLFMDQETQNV